MLPRALGTSNIVFLEPVDTLPAEYGMTVCRVQRVRDAFLAAKAISAIMRLPIHDVSGDTIGVLSEGSRRSRRTGCRELVFFSRRDFEDTGVFFHVVVSPLIYFKPSGSVTK